MIGGSMRLGKRARGAHESAPARARPCRERQARFICSTIGSERAALSVQCSATVSACAERVGLGAGVDAEQRASRDRHRDARGLHGDVDLGAVLPDRTVCSAHSTMHSANASIFA